MIAFALKADFECPIILSHFYTCQRISCFRKHLFFCVGGKHLTELRSAALVLSIRFFSLTCGIPAGDQTIFL